MEEQMIVTRFYEGILGIPDTWKVVQVRKDMAAKEVNINLEYAAQSCTCPVCGKPGKLYDHRARKMRHLDTRDYKTLLEVKVPRVTCPEHGVQQVEIEFAEKHTLTGTPSLNTSTPPRRSISKQVTRLSP
jgi:transposase